MFKLSVLNRCDFDFCVRSSQLWGNSSRILKAIIISTPNERRRTTPAHFCGGWGGCDHFYISFWAVLKRHFPVCKISLKSVAFVLFLLRFCLTLCRTSLLSLVFWAGQRNNWLTLPFHINLHGDKLCWGLYRMVVLTFTVVLGEYFTHACIEMFLPLLLFRVLSWNFMTLSVTCPHTLWACVFISLI